MADAGEIIAGGGVAAAGAGAFVGRRLAGWAHFVPAHDTRAEFEDSPEFDPAEDAARKAGDQG